MTQVNGNGLLQRKCLKKKHRLQGLTAHGAPLLLPVGGAPVARAFVYPGRVALPGGRRFWGGGCWGLFFQGQGTQTILKNKRKSQRSQGSLLRGVHRAHQSCSAHHPLPQLGSRPQVVNCGGPSLWGGLTVFTQHSNRRICRQEILLPSSRPVI